MIITLTTDFGLADPFVGVMKGVILGIAPAATLVDISHDISSYDLDEAAFLLSTAVPFFPPGTVHLVVVDPGVGTRRRPIAAAAGGHFFVGPDNGVFSLAFARAETSRVHHIVNSEYFRNPVSQTFHGRDVFAPTAAHLAAGAPLIAVGPVVEDPVRRSLPIPRPIEGRSWIARVVHIDHFGNVVTNLRPEHLGDRFCIRFSGAAITRLCASFAEGAPEEVFAIEGSTGFIEIAMNRKSAAEHLQIQRSMEFEVETPPLNH